MRGLLKQYVDREISRREFAVGLAALGFSAAAADSLAAALGGVQQPVPAEGVSVKGTGAEIFVETLRAAGIRNIFGTTATGMSPLFDAVTLRPDIRMILSMAESQATSMAHGFELASLRTCGALRAGRRRAEHAQQSLQRLEGPLRDRGVFRRTRRRVPGPQRLRADGQLDRPGRPSSPSGSGRSDNVSQISEMTRRAIKVAQTPPGGPVHIRFPNEILGARDVEQIDLSAEPVHRAGRDAAEA